VLCCSNSIRASAQLRFVKITTSGTLIAAFLLRDQVFLFSDGRVIDADSGQVHDDWSKVHHLAPMVGMLTAGHYVPHLRDDICRNSSERNVSTVDGVANIAGLVLSETWRRFESAPENAAKIALARVFVFIAGFDAHAEARLFYLDSTSTPRFRLQERSLFSPGRDLEIAAMSTGSGATENPSALLINEVQTRLRSQVDFDVLCSAFDATKAELAKTNDRIGGVTFAAVVDRRTGFRDARAPSE
jgi:hypothetical protein